MPLAGERTAAAAAGEEGGLPAVSMPTVYPVAVRIDPTAVRDLHSIPTHRLHCTLFSTASAVSLDAFSLTNECAVQWFAVPAASPRWQTACCHLL